MADNAVGREAIDLLTKARKEIGEELAQVIVCLLYTSPSPRDS